MEKIRAEIFPVLYGMGFRKSLKLILLLCIYCVCFSVFMMFGMDTRT